MVSVTLMARLLEALAPATHLVLVGDPDQLASVEAGAVLGDLVESDDEAPALHGAVATLRTVYRFDAGGVIATLAQCVRDGRADDALDLLTSGSDGLVFHEAPDDEPLTGAALDAVRRLTSHERAVIETARAGDVAAVARRPRRAPPAVRAPARSARRAALERRDRALVARRRPDPRAASRRTLCRAAAPGHGERLRERAVQRRHRCRRGAGRRPRRRVPPWRRAGHAAAGAARRRCHRCTR